MKEIKLSKIEIFSFTIFSLVTIIFLWDFAFIYPFKFFVTAVHEGFHGLATLLTGGEIADIVLNLDGSGSLSRYGGIGLIISPAGYVGTAIIGSLLILSSNSRFNSTLIVLVLSLYIIILNFMYIDSYFSIVFWIVLIVSIFFMYISFNPEVNKHLTLFLGTFFIMSSIEDIKTYLLSDVSHKTDAGILANSLGMSFLTPIIALSFFLITVFIYYKTLKIVFKREES